MRAVYAHRAACPARPSGLHPWRRVAGSRWELGLADHHQRRRRGVEEIFLEARHRDAEDRPVAAHRRDEALHPEPPQDACLAARPVFALDSLGRAASVDATPEIFGRLAEGRQVSTCRELFPQARTELQLQDAVQQERRAVREPREVHHSEPHREPPGAVAHRVSDQPPAGQRMERQEQPRDAAAEQHQDEQRREQPLAPWRFQRQARRQPVSEQPQKSQTRSQCPEPTQVQPVSAQQRQVPQGARAFLRQSWQLRQRPPQRQDPENACARARRARRRSSSSASSFR